MTNNINDALIAAIGVSDAADRVLGSEQFTADAEIFFLRHHAKLSWRQLLIWLRHPEPEPDEHRRPGAAIAARIAESWKADTGLLAMTEIVPFTAAVHDAALRDEIVVALRKLADETHIARIACLATGGNVFTRIRDVERRVLDREGMPPGGVLDGGVIPMLTSRLLVGTRHDSDVLPVLHQILREEPLRYYATWLLREAGLLARFKLDEVLGALTMPVGGDGKEVARAHFLFDVAFTWPDHAARSAWFMKRTLDAVAGGASWLSLWWEIPPDLRDPIAIASLATSKPAPWVWRAVTTSLPGHEAWAAAFDLVERDLPGFENDEFNAGFAIAIRILDRHPTHAEIEEAFQACHDESRLAWIVKLDLPGDADDAFDARYIGLMRRFDRPEHVIVQGLSALPLTPARARRIIALALECGLFWSLDGFLDLARAAGQIDVEVDLPPYATSDVVAAFKVLVGDKADQLLTDRLEALIADGEIYEALSLAAAVHETLAPALRDRLKQLVLAEPITRLAHTQANQPWLLTEADVVAAASAAGDDAWGFTELIPPYLAPVMTVKAVTTESVSLAESLLDRLLKLDVPKSEVLDLALERVRTRGPNSLGPWPLAKLLDSRTAWDTAGTKLARDLLAQGVDGATLLYNVCLETAMNAKPEAGSLGQTMHTAVGAALVGVAHEALLATDQVRARKALKGIAHLNPRSELRGRVRALRKLEPDPDVLSVIEVNESLMRRSGKNDAATSDDVMKALVALFGSDDDVEDAS